MSDERFRILSRCAYPHSKDASLIDLRWYGTDANWIIDDDGIVTACAEELASFMYSCVPAVIVDKAMTLYKARVDE